jgi:hypothetical protein
LHQGKTVVILKALYGLCTSSERWHSHFSDTLRKLDFKRSCFDNDMWIKLNEADDAYDYLCTHVDDFMICLKNPKAIMDRIEGIYTQYRTSALPDTISVTITRKTGRDDGASAARST